MTTLDSYCRERISANPNMLVPWWIMAAWVYDQHRGGEVLISDALFDEIAERLDREWETITHWHKPLLDRRLLKSALAIRGQWPLRAVHCAQIRLQHGPPASFLAVPASSPKPSQMELF